MGRGGGGTSKAQYFTPLVPIPMYKTHFYLCLWGVGRGNSTQDLAIERKEEESGERRGGGEKVEKRTKGGGGGEKVEKRMKGGGGGEGGWGEGDGGREMGEGGWDGGRREREIEEERGRKRKERGEKERQEVNINFTVNCAD